MISKEAIEKALRAYLTEGCAQKGEPFDWGSYLLYVPEEDVDCEIHAMKAALEASGLVEENERLKKAEVKRLEAAYVTTEKLSDELLEENQKLQQEIEQAKSYISDIGFKQSFWMWKMAQALSNKENHE